MSNRLADETSPYLLQHKDNPVEWWPWGEDAFAEAKRRDVPVLLSVGYAACHWCHVMAHESFEDDEVAKLLNHLFVNVKVDREERPDVDAVYMEVTQAMTGSGGWPMTVWMTPDAAPFVAGTYFPKPQLIDISLRIAKVWTEDRTRVEATGRDIVETLNRPRRGLEGAPPSAEDLDAAIDRLAQDFDATHGGFGGAPKFPPSSVLEWLLRAHARRGDPQSLAMAMTTLERMARGGLYDQLAGGFARYSVDAQWVVPHFEKMLYDNAQLARVYAHAFRLTGDALCARIARETCAWMITDLRTAEGGFASALDADTDGVEGLTYAWRRDQLDEQLADLLVVTENGTFEHGLSTLQLPRDPADPQWWAAQRRQLLALRNARPQPARDDKVVAAWNGLAIGALADCALLLDEPTFLDAAGNAAALLLDLHVVGGRLRRVSRDGVVGRHAGVLDDHGSLADGLLALHQATGERRWLDAALALLDDVLTHFREDDGTFADTADDAQTLVSRPADASDGATASGASTAAQALLTAAALTGDARLRDAALTGVGALAGLVRQAPRFFGWTAATAEAVLAGPLEVAVVGRPDLLAIARRATSPGAVVVAGPGDSPLLAGRDEPAAYVCRGTVCELPTTDAAVLARQVGARA